VSGVEGGLAGKRVLIARAEGQADGPARLLHERGAEPVVIPSIVIGPPDDDGPVRRSLVRRSDVDWVAFTSANGVEHACRVLEEQGLGLDALGAARFAVVGKATREALGARGGVADVVAREHRAEGLAADMIAAMKATPTGRRPHVLLLCAQEARDVLPRALVGAGATVEVVAVYRTRPCPEGAAEIERRLKSGLLDAVVFSSGSTVDSICEALGPTAPAALAPVTVACIGPVTEAAARARGIRVDVLPAAATFAGVVDALEEHFLRYWTL
jgi:uroporphyrinogen III methyltransferase/synthase